MDPGVRSGTASSEKGGTIVSDKPPDEIIEYQSAERLRFELIDQETRKVKRAVEAPWSELKDPVARDRLLARLFE